MVNKDLRQRFIWLPKTPEAKDRVGSPKESMCVVPAARDRLPGQRVGTDRGGRKEAIAGEAGGKPEEWHTRHH